MDIAQTLGLIRAPGVAISLVAAVIGLILVVWVTRTPWFAGYLGELRVRSIIRRELDGGVYHALHDVTLPTLGGTTQIDHILVSRYGVFVIETKNMKGRIYGRASDQLWTQAFIGRSFTFLNPLRQNFKHLKAVKAVLGLESWRVHSIVVFVGTATFGAPMPTNVCGLRGLVPMLCSRRRIALNDAEVRNAVERLAGSRIPTLVADWLHRRSLNQIRARARDAQGPSRIRNRASVS